MTLGLKVTDFRKLNAESKEVNGQKVYVYQFLSAAEVPNGFAFRTKGAGGELGLSKDPGVGARSGWLGEFTPLPKGTTGIRRGTITFRLTAGNGQRSPARA
jgi:hypothetical protein